MGKISLGHRTCPMMYAKPHSEVLSVREFHENVFTGGSGGTGLSYCVRNYFFVR